MRLESPLASTARILDGIPLPEESRGTRPGRGTDSGSTDDRQHPWQTPPLSNSGSGEATSPVMAHPPGARPLQPRTRQHTVEPRKGAADRPECSSHRHRNRRLIALAMRRRSRPVCTVRSSGRAKYLGPRPPLGVTVHGTRSMKCPTLEGSSWPPNRVAFLSQPDRTPYRLKDLFKLLRIADRANQGESFDLHVGKRMLQARGTG